MPLIFSVIHLIKMSLTAKILNGDTNNKRKYAQNNILYRKNGTILRGNTLKHIDFPLLLSII